MKTRARDAPINNLASDTENCQKLQRPWCDQTNQAKITKASPSDSHIIVVFGE